MASPRFPIYPQSPSALFASGGNLLKISSRCTQHRAQQIRSRIGSTHSYFTASSSSCTHHQKEPTPLVSFQRIHRLVPADVPHLEAQRPAARGDRAVPEGLGLDAVPPHVAEAVYEDLGIAMPRAAEVRGRAVEADQLDGLEPPPRSA